MKSPTLFKLPAALSVFALMAVFAITSGAVSGIKTSSKTSTTVSKTKNKDAAKPKAAPAPANTAKSGASKTDDIKTKQEPEKADPLAKVGEALRKGKPVFIYFYSDKIDDSLDQLESVNKVAKSGGAEVFKINSEEYQAPFFAYEAQYAPTVVLIRPDAGLVGFWEVDLPESEMATALARKVKPNDKQKQIAEAIKKKKPQLVFFMAKWCGYCMQTLPKVNKFDKDFANCIETVTIDVDEWPEMQDAYMVNGVPVILLMDSNGVIRLRTGYPSGYERFKSVFEGMDGATKACMAGVKKAGDST